MKKIVSIFFLVVFAMFLAACGSDDDTTKNTGDTIESDSSVAFVGKVVDVNGNPMSGVSVELLADKKYNASTDSNGNYIIDVDLGKIVASPGGGSGTAGSGDLDSAEGDVISRNFPIEYSRSGYAVYRQEVDLSLTVGYTDGSGAVVLLSKTGTVQPTVVLHPYVDNFQFTVYAGADPAPGATILFWRNAGPKAGGTAGPQEEDSNDPAVNTGSAFGDRYEVDTRMFVSDENGVVSITAADMLPADGNYLVFGAPYDMDGDGVYEYDSTILTQPTGGFNLDVQYEINDLIHYEYDSTTDSYVIRQTEFAPSVLYQDASTDIVVTYCSIDNVQNIPIAQAEDFEIVVMFNRPVTEQVLASINGPLFTLTSGGFNVPITWETDNNYWWTITPASTLTPAGNVYAFTVANGLSAAGGIGGGLFAQQFSIYNPDATMMTGITPGVDIELSTSYRVDWDDIMIGDGDTSNPFADAGMIPALNLSWAVDPDATGYEVWLKGSGTDWQQVTWPTPGTAVTFTYNDGQFIEANVSLNTATPVPFGGLFDAFDAANTFGLNATEPFFGGNVIQAIVMPQNENGFAADPNGIDTADGTLIPLSLSDNFGPEVIAGAGWEGSASDFTAATRFDDTSLVIAVDEPLSDATLTAEYAAGQYGARGSSGYFTVSDVYWPDNDLADPAVDDYYPSNRGYILVDLEADIATTLTAAASAGDTSLAVTAEDMDDFAFGDVLANAGIDLGPIIGFDTTQGTFLLGGGGIPSAIANGGSVYWRGPIQAGYEEVADTLDAASDAFDNFIWIADATNIAAGQTFLTQPAGGVVTGVLNTGTLDRVTLTDAPGNALPSGTAVSGYSVGAAAGDLAGNDTADAESIANTVLAAPAADTDTTITVADADDIENGDVLILQFTGNNQQTVTVTDASTAPVITISPALTLTANLPAGTTVQQRLVLTGKSMVAAYPLLDLGTLAGIKPNSTIEVDDGTETDSATVTGIYNALPGSGTLVSIDDILVDSTNTRYTFAAGSDYTVDSSRVNDVLQVNLIDRSSNDSGDTDSDGDGNANFDQIGYDEVGGAFDVF